MDKKVTISIDEYYRLLQAEAQLNLLENRGVDNWHGYTTIPSIDEFDSIEEWETTIANISTDDY